METNIVIQSTQREHFLFADCFRTTDYSVQNDKSIIAIRIEEINPGWDYRSRNVTRLICTLLIRRLQTQTPPHVLVDESAWVFIQPVGVGH